MRLEDVQYEARLVVTACNDPCCEVDDLRRAADVLEKLLAALEGRPDAHAPRDNCLNNAAVSRHDSEIKVLQAQMSMLLNRR